MIISDKIYINMQELGDDFYNLTDLFTYSNPEFHERVRMKLTTNGISEYIHHYKIVAKKDGGKTLVLPRGGVLKVKQYYEYKKIPYRVTNNMIELDPIDVELINTKIEFQQDDIVNALIENTGGLIEASPGLGKTVGILYLISRVKQPVLILVHEHRLRTQWEQEIKLRLGGTYKFGRFDGDKKIMGDVCIGLIQTVHKMVDADPLFLHKFGMLVIDEVHHSPSTTFMKVLNNSPSKWRVGVTGTVERKDGKHILMYDTLGEVIKKISEHEVKHRITTFETEVVNTNLKIELPSCMRWTGRKKEAQVSITEAITLLTQNPERNSMILKNVVDNISSGYLPLIISDRTEHSKHMYNHLTELGFKCVMLIGATRKKTKWEEVRKDKTIQCVIAQSSIASEGLDYPSLSALHLTCPSSNLPKLKQKIGRIRRVCKGKKTPIVYDYVDNLAYYIDSNGAPQYVLKGGAIKRIKFYKQLQNDYGDDESSD